LFGLADIYLRNRCDVVVGRRSDELYRRLRRCSAQRELYKSPPPFNKTQDILVRLKVEHHFFLAS
jgi:hypothetical protein